MQTRTAGEMEARLLKRGIAPKDRDPKYTFRMLQLGTLRVTLGESGESSKPNHHAAARAILLDALKGTSLEGGSAPALLSPLLAAKLYRVDEWSESRRELRAWAEQQMTKIEGQE